MKEKSIHLLIAVVNYFNGALLYYNQTSFGYSHRPAVTHNQRIY